jgi:hypothetical protein
MVYADRELSSPNYSYEFDLTNGKVVPENSSSGWSLHRGSNDWSSSEDNDVYIPPTAQLTPQQCAEAISQHPSGDITADQGQTFCIRERSTGSIVIAKVEQLDGDQVKLSLTYYRYGN